MFLNQSLVNETIESMVLLASTAPAWIIFERPGDAMSYFSTEEVDNLKSLRAMVTEDLINETDYEDAKGTILAVAKKRRLFSRSRLMTFATSVLGFEFW